jgi:hypothetical protein
VVDTISQIAGRRFDMQTTRAETVVATVSLALLMVKIPGFSLFPLPGTLIGLMLAIVVLPALRQIPAAFSVLWTSLIAAVVGIALSLTIPETRGTVGSALDIASILGWLIAIPLLVAVGLWGVSIVGPLVGFRLIALGGLASALLGSGALVWKGSIGFYATFLALTLTAGSTGTRLIVTRVILVAAVSLGATNDARSMAAIAGTVLIVSFLAAPFGASLLKYRKTWAIVLIGLLLGISTLALAAMTSGLLGSAIQARTLDQTAGGRSILEAGRAEWAATLFLAREVPFGFGVGTHIDPGLANSAISAVRAAGGDANASYFRVLVFGDRTDLHSIAADLWVHFGLGGLVVIGSIGLCLVIALPLAAGKIGSIGAFILFGVLTASWDLMFSPMGNVDRLVVGLICAAYMIGSLSTSNGRGASSVLCHDSEPRKLQTFAAMPRYKKTKPGVSRAQASAPSSH